MPLTRIGSIGINTGIAFAGVTTIVTLNTANDALSIGATVNVGSGITLGASGDIFATGVSTVTTLKVGSGVTVSSDGDVFFTGIATGNGSGLTAINASNIGSGTVPTARLGSGTASSSTFLRGDSTFQTVNTDLVSDTSPQLGGNLDVNTKNIVFGDSASSSDDRLQFGASQDLEIYHNGSASYIKDSGTGYLLVLASGFAVQNAAGSETIMSMVEDGAVDLYYNDSKKFETTSTGITISGSNTTGSVVQGDFRFKNASGTQHIVYDASESRINFADSTYATFGDANDLQIYHDGSSSFIKDTAGASFTIQATESIAIKTNNTEFAIACNKNGSVELYHDNTLQCSTAADGLSFPSGKGINFSATANSSGSMSNETLDDYEEGTWTPTLSSGTFTAYLNQWYTKIGQVVTCYCYLYNFSDTSSNTHFNISGLPFAYKTNHEATVQFMSNGSASLPSNCMGIWGRIGVTGNSDQIAVYTHFNTTGGGIFKHSDLGSTHLMATFTYVTGS